MPNMKYFQVIADMRNYYEDRLEILKRAASDPQVLEAYELTVKDQPVLERKIRTLQYLLACQHGYSPDDTAITQPDYSTFQEVFVEQYDLMAERIEQIKDTTHPQLKSVAKMYKKRHSCAIYYLEKLKDPVYLKKLPITIKAI